MLKDDPQLYYTDKFSELRELVDTIINEESEEEEEAPPEFMENKSEKIKKLVDEAKYCIEQQNYKLGLEKCNEALKENANSVKSLRSRSFIFSKLLLYKEAYEDICKAQSIDFSEEFVSFQNDMKTHISKKTTEKTNNIPDMKLQDLLNNEQFRDMANTMMKDPQFMQTMNNMSTMFSGNNMKF